MGNLEVARDLARARSFGMCEGCRTFGVHLDPHHRCTRGSGGVHRAAEAASNDVRNLLMLCREKCHERTLAAAAECITLGWVVERRSGVDSHLVPALIHTVNGYGWWYLTEDGGYLWAGLPDTYRLPSDSTPPGGRTDVTDG